MATSDLVVKLRLDTSEMQQALRALAEHFVTCADALAQSESVNDKKDE